MKRTDARLKTTTLPPDRTRPVPEAFGALTWEDLGTWTDSGSLRRGRSYVGNVSDVGITEDGRVVATVSGSDDYATEVRFDESGELQGRCTCPVGRRCKHTVALVLACIARLGEGKPLPLLDASDERIAELEEDAAFEENDEEDDWGEEEDDRDDKAGTGKQDKFPEDDGAGEAHGSARAIPRHALPRDELDERLDGLDAAGARRMLREIFGANPAIRADWLRRVRTEKGGVAQLLAMARKELRRLAREEAWVNPWKHEFHVPDYAPLRRILQGLSDKRAFDDLVAFGDSIREETRPQVESADDEGDTARQICSCMEIVAEAVRASSLSAVERLRWFADLHDEDGYATYDDIYDPFDHPEDWRTEDWSVYADELRADFDDGRPNGGDGGDDTDDGDWRRERKLRRLCNALRNAGREDEARTLRIRWLESKGDFLGLSKLLFAEGDLSAAWDTAVAGIAAHRPKPGDWRDPRSALRLQLREIAMKRGDADLALRLQAEDFFDDPSASGFFDLLAAAKPLGLAAALRPWLVRFLETGARPDRPPAGSEPVAESPEPAPPRRGRGRPPKKRTRGDTTAPRKPDRVPPPPEGAPDWPLAPSGVAENASSTRDEPGAIVLLRIALQEKDAESVLARWRAAVGADGNSRVDRFGPLGHLSGEVADALVAAHPEESLRIWDAEIESTLPSTGNWAYETIASLLRKQRPVMERLGRAAEWEARVRSLREGYRRRPNFVKELDAVLGEPAAAKTILETRRRAR